MIVVEVMHNVWRRLCVCCALMSGLGLLTYRISHTTPSHTLYCFPSHALTHTYTHRNSVSLFIFISRTLSASLILSHSHSLPLLPCLLFTGHIFPVGFKCIRQEHDALLDKVVDIQCEIEAMSEETKATGSHPPVRTLVPLFRVSVAWEIKGSQVVRVYEARSPQQAWQAAVLEKIGIDAAGNAAENDGSPPISVVEKIEGADEGLDAEGIYRLSLEKEIEKAKEKENQLEESERERDIAYESEDAEERQLRSEIRDQRRTFFRALRIEQRCVNTAVSIFAC